MPCPSLPSPALPCAELPCPCPDLPWTPLPPPAMPLPWTPPPSPACLPARLPDLDPLLEAYSEGRPLEDLAGESILGLGMQEEGGEAGGLGRSLDPFLSKTLKRVGTLRGEGRGRDAATRVGKGGGGGVILGGRMGGLAQYSPSP